MLTSSSEGETRILFYNHCVQPHSPCLHPVNKFTLHYQNTSSTPNHPSTTSQMDTSSLTPSAPLTQHTAPTPPATLFRTIKLLSSCPSTQTSTYLCLPRILPPPIPLGVPSAPDAPNLNTPHIAAVHAIAAAGLSALPPRFLAMLPHLRTVTTAPRTALLRPHVALLEYLHFAAPRADTAAAHLADELAGVQFAAAHALSYVALAPVFARSVARVCGAADGGVPGYFVARVVLGVVGAVEWLHGAGVAHGAVAAENVVLDADAWMRGAGCGVRLRGFAGARRLDAVGEQADARAVVELLARMVAEWSDVAGFLGTLGDEAGDEPLVGLLRGARGMLDANEAFGMGDVRRVFGERLERLRDQSPAKLPVELVRRMHDDLVTEEEMARALEEPVVLKVPSRREELDRMARGESSVAERSNIIVLRFTVAKREFLRAMN
ncbi:hypothetical protein ACN47E_002823 [Coniothyrium glycines]